MRPSVLPDLLAQWALRAFPGAVNFAAQFFVYHEGEDHVQQ
jgi:hypothetical protein